MSGTVCFRRLKEPVVELQMVECFLYILWVLSINRDCIEFDLWNSRHCNIEGCKSRLFAQSIRSINLLRLQAQLPRQ